MIAASVKPLCPLITSFTCFPICYAHVILFNAGATSTSAEFTVGSWFLLKNPQERLSLFYMALCDVILPPRNRLLSRILLTSASVQFFAEWRHCLWHTNSTNSVVFPAFSRNFLWHFSIQSYQNARIMICSPTYLFHCINSSWVLQKMFENSACDVVFRQLPWDPAWKHVWSVYYKIPFLKANSVDPVFCSIWSGSPLFAKAFLWDDQWNR